MGLTRDVLKKVRTRLLGGMGEKLVSVLADTSSDAPTRFAAPKRDLYERLENSGVSSQGNAAGSSADPTKKS